MTDNMNPIETREIRGINARTMWWAVTIVVAVCFSYFSLKGAISGIQKDSYNDRKYDDLRMRTMELRISALELDIKDLRNKVDETVIEVEKIKQK